METLTLYALLAYMAVVFGIAFKNRIFEDGRGFVIGARQIGTFSTASSIAAGLRDGTGIVSWITLAAAVGYGASWLILALAAMMIVVSFIAPKVRSIAAEINAVTIQDIIQHKVGRRLSVATSIVVFVAGLLYVAANLNIIGTLFSTIIGAPREATILVTAAFVGLYLFIGGYRSVIKTDVFQLFILFAISIIPFMNMNVPNFSESMQMFTALDQETFIGFIGIGAFYAFAASEYWQRMMSAKDENSAKKGMQMGAAFLIFITFGLLGIGIWLQQLMPNVPSSEVYSAIFNNIDNIPVWIPTLVALIVASAVMSTIDTQVSLISTTVVSNIFKVDTTKDHMRFVRLCRVMIVFIMIVMALAALFVGDIVQFMFDAVTVIIIPASLYLYAIFCKKYTCAKRDLFLAVTTLAGTGAHLYMFATDAFGNLIHNLYPVIGVSIAVGLFALVERYILKK